MRATPHFILAALCAALAAGTAGAEGLGLGRARDLALAESKVLAGALLAVDSAKLDEKSRRLSLLPTVVAGAGASLGWSARDGGSGSGLSGTLAVTQSVWDGGQSSILAAIDALATESAREGARSAYFSALAAVDKAWYAALERRASAESAAADLEAARLHERIAAARLESGAASRADLLKSQAERAAKESAAAQARMGQAAADAKLASLTGSAEPAASLDFSAWEATASRLAALDGEEAAALTARLSGVAARSPAMLSASIVARAASRRAELARAASRPSLSASFKHSLSWSPAVGLDSGSGSVSLGLSVPLDLGSARAAADSRDVAARSSALALEEARRAQDLDLATATYSCLSAARGLASSSAALDYAAAYYEGALESYRLSTTSSSELSDAAALLGAARSALISARFQFLGGLADLRALAGLADEDLLAAMAPW